MSSTTRTLRGVFRWIRSVRESIVVALIGMVIGALGSNFLDSGALSQDQKAILTPLGLAVCLLSIAIVYIAQRTPREIGVELDKRLSQLAKRCEVVRESNIERIEEESKCYEVLCSLIDRAEKSVFVVPNPNRDAELEKEEKFWDLEPREEYLDRIEERIKEIDARIQDGECVEPLQYTRIQQIPATRKKPLSAYFGKLAWNHVVNLHAGRYSGVKLMTIDSDEVSGQLIIDDEILVKFIRGVDKQKNKRLMAISILRDPFGTNIREYCVHTKDHLVAAASFFCPEDGEVT